MAWLRLWSKRDAYQEYLYIQAVLRTHVNLVDLTEMPGSGRRVTLFKTEKQLSEYTRWSERFFPKDSPHAGGLLRFLFRQIRNPELSNRDRSQKRKKQEKVQ